MVPLSRGDWLSLLLANVLSAAATALAVTRFPGAASAWACNLLSLVVLAAWVHRHPQPWFARLFWFGLVTGVVELANDTWLVRGRQVLVYAQDGPFILSTPACMPLSRALVFVTLGVDAWVLEGWA